MDFILSFNNGYWYGSPQMIFPVVPNGGVQFERSQNNVSFDGVNGEMLSIGELNLASFSIESIFPLRPYNWTRPGSSSDGWAYVRTIEKIRRERIPFRAVLLDNNGETIFNVPAAVDSFTYYVDQAHDISYSLTFKEYRFATMETADLAADPLKGISDAVKNASIGSTNITNASTTVSDAGTKTPPLTRYTNDDVVKMAKTMYGEARGLPKVEIACVGWCILNRVDDSRFPSTISGVITQKSQFSGWNANNPTTADGGFSLIDLAKDVCNRWSWEKTGQANVGRVLPAGYCWFKGFSGHNWFRKDNKAQAAGAWDYSLPNPYV